jgi:membrane protease YdiL (CAAX protease family)
MEKLSSIRHYNGVTLPWATRRFPKLPLWKLILLFFFSVFVILVSNIFILLAFSPSLIVFSTESPVKINVPISYVFSYLTSVPMWEYGKILATMIGAGVREEFFCRFFIFRLVCMEYLHLPLGISLFLSSLVFSAMHIGNVPVYNSQNINRQQILHTFLAGFIYGYLYYYTNNLLFVMFVHGVFDLLITFNQIISKAYIKSLTKKQLPSPSTA